MLFTFLIVVRIDIHVIEVKQYDIPKVNGNREVPHALLKGKESGDEDWVINLLDCQKRTDLYGITNFSISSTV